MKRFAVIPLVFFSLLAASQPRVHSFAEIDFLASSIKPAPARQLAYDLTAGYTTEKEKVRSLFSWITGNISYRVRRKFISQRSVNAEAALFEKIDSCRCKSANEIIAESVIMSREAVCEGYAKLFKTLCDFAGLKAAIITGFGRTNFPRVDEKLRSNHSWNAVMIDSSWYLLDLTWASGYTSYFGNEFIPHLNEHYFLTPPDLFIEDHIPDDMRWSLLPELPAAPEFNRQPFKQKPFVKYNIVSYQPAKGVINVTEGDTLNFVLEIPAESQLKKIATDTAGTEAATLPYISGMQFLQPTVRGSKLYYQFPVANPNSFWVCLMYNDDAVLRYRINVEPGKKTAIL